MQPAGDSCVIDSVNPTYYSPFPLLQLLLTPHVRSSLSLEDSKHAVPSMRSSVSQRFNVQEMSYNSRGIRRHGSQESRKHRRSCRLKASDNFRIASRPFIDLFSRRVGIQSTVIVVPKRFVAWGRIVPEPELEVRTRNIVC